MNCKIICPCCQCNAARDLPFFQLSRLAKCPQCHLVFDCRTPTTEELSAFYKTYSYSSLKTCPEATIRSFNRVLDELEIHKNVGNILDIGCGQGDFLFEARRRGWQCFGSEHSDAAINLCSNRKLNVIKEPISRQSFAGIKFDVVTSFEVIEHIQTPNELFQLAHDLLRPGGVFYLTTPNFNAVLRFFEGADFAIINYPEHLCFFSKKTIQTLAERHSFVTQRITTSGLDLARLRNALPKLPIGSRSSLSSFHTRKTHNDLIREKIELSPTLFKAKNLANFILGATGKGDTLKAWLIKKDTA